MARWEEVYSGCHSYCHGQPFSMCSAHYKPNLQQSIFTASQWRWSLLLKPTILLHLLLWLIRHICLSFIQAWSVGKPSKKSKQQPLFSISLDDSSWEKKREKKTKKKETNINNNFFGPFFMSEFVREIPAIAMKSAMTKGIAKPLGDHLVSTTTCNQLQEICNLLTVEQRVWSLGDCLLEWTVLLSISSLFSFSSLVPASKL